MPWYKSEGWGDTLKNLSLWWAHCADFVTFEGEKYPHRQCSSLVDDLAHWCYEETNIDPMPLWELAMLIDEYGDWHRPVRQSEEVPSMDLIRWHQTRAMLVVRSLSAPCPHHVK